MGEPGHRDLLNMKCELNSEHYGEREPGHRDLLNKKCEECEKHAAFGDAADKIARFCAVHRGDRHVDLINKSAGA
ncbi:hypothetical protein T484DRAFT_1839474 [Baffinella frigidus]|nr:hypothetical protein T484DRAFT_1839474 [Cryptophyta sp. CCMP2293]